MEIRKRFLIFGASITYGAWDREGGWVARLRKLLDERNIDEPERYYYTIFNLGVSGATVSDILERIVSETRPRVRERGEDIIILSVGGGDANIDNRTGKPKTDPQTFSKNIEELLRVVTSISDKNFFVGLTPVDESRTSPVPWMPEVSCKNEVLSGYNKIIKEACEEKEVPIIDLMDRFLGSDHKNLIEDGIHPNSEGHELIFEIVRDYLEENKII